MEILTEPCEGFSYKPQGVIMSGRLPELVLENAKIIFVNFKGREGMYNREGDRNFCVLLDEEIAKQLDRDGWNVKALRAREEGDPDQPYLQVSVGFKAFPPRMVLIGEKSRRRTELDEESCEIIDHVDRVNVDLVIRPYRWEVNGRGGIKAYLKTIYVTIAEDPLDLKYGDMDLEQLPSMGGKVIE
jgi:hypothetical protein